MDLNKGAIPSIRKLAFSELATMYGCLLLYLPQGLADG